MSLKDRYDFETLVNEAENLVLQELEAQLAKRGAFSSAAGAAARALSSGSGDSAARGAICTCQDCILDMAALALNLTPPSYRVSLLGSIVAQQGGAAHHMKSVSKAVSEAIEKVQANRSHD
jgi:competence protein ComFB